MHKVEGLVDPIERQGMRDQIVDVDAPFHVPVDDPGNVAPPTRAAERGSFPGATGDQLEWPRGDLLPGPRHPDDHAGTPSALTALERLPHQLGVAHAFEREIRTAAGQVDQVGNQIAFELRRIYEMGGPELTRDRFARR